MKRFFAALLTAAMVLSLTACGQTSAPASTATPQNSAPSSSSAATGMPATSSEAGGTNDIKTSVAFWHGATDDVKQTCFDNAIGRFNKQYPNVTVTQTKLDSDGYKTKLKVVMASNEIPDVFMSWGGSWLNEFVKAGKVLEITDRIKTIEDEYMPVAFSLAEYDGKRYGISTNMGPSMVFYNKEIFQEVGIEIPKTDAELDAACAKLKAAGYIPFALGNKNKWPGALEYIFQCMRIGGKDAFVTALNRTGGKFNDPTFVEAGQHLVDFVDKGYYPDGTNGIDHNTGGSRMMFYGEKAAMFIMTNGFLSNCKAEDPEFYEQKLGMFNYPTVVGGKGDANDILAGGNMFSISTQCKNVDVAFDLLHRITDKDYAQEYVDKGSVFNGAKGIAISDPLTQEMFDIMGKATYSQHFYDQSLPAEMAELHKDTTQAVYGKTMTPQEAADKMETEAVKLMGESKAK